MAYYSISSYRSTFSCDRPLQDTSDAQIQAFFNQAECYAETFAQAGGYTLPLTAKQQLFLQDCVFNHVRFLWANSADLCTDEISKRWDGCQKLLKDIKDRKCPLPIDEVVSSTGCFAIGEWCRA